ncbi:hypothetical protein F5Y03DRAFT_30370 [Xylaria venustula]|nr:hypothetical protein F5Y03DRAFT_30370 [Xylaria venustula]
MSRALDKTLLSQLKSEDPRPVYNDLSSIFARLPDSGLLEIDFLGAHYPLEADVNFLQEGNAIAIPKLRLVQAFFVARQILQHHLENASEVISNDVLAATAIALLMDSEHLTAANIRKRALSIPGNLTPAALKREQSFVDTLLTARLHRHTKSPTLWSHRRWLITTGLKVGIPLDIRYDIKQVVMVAGERHPRNYVAWQHARLLLDRDLSLAATVAFDVKEFCLRHHSDISCWAFLLDCIARIQDEESRRSICSSVLDDVLSLTESFRWTNESVWVFLRTIIAKDASEQDLKRFIAANDRLSATLPHNSSKLTIMIRAREWCDKYGVPKAA